MKRKIILILISILIIISFTMLTLFGFFSPYNYYSAKQEIRKNKFIKICINEHPVYYKIEKYVGRKYGFDVINFENINHIKPIYLPGIKIYNSLMKSAYINKYGDNLFNEYQKELDSICNRHIVK